MLKLNAKPNFDQYNIPKLKLYLLNKKCDHFVEREGERETRGATLVLLNN